MSSYLKFSFLILVSLILAACGGGDKIDAKNADTLKSSLKDIASSMSEVERQAFGQDVIAVFQHKNLGADKLGQSSLYSNQYDALFSSDPNAAVLFSGAFKEMALKAGDVLNDKTPADLAKDAKEIRSSYYASYAAKLEQDKEALVTRHDAISDAIENHHLARKASEARQIALAKQTTGAVGNVSITELTINRRLQAQLKGTADITNYSDLPVTHVRHRLDLDLPGVEKHSFSAIHNLALPSPLAPGETLHAHSFTLATIATTTIRRERGAKRIRLSSLVGNLETANPRAELISYSALDANGRSTRRQLVLSSEDQIMLRNFEKILQKCETSKSKLKESITANDVLIEKVKAVIDDPKPVEGRFLSVNIFGNDC